MNNTMYIINVHISMHSTVKLGFVGQFYTTGEKYKEAGLKLKIN